MSWADPDSWISTVNFFRMNNDFMSVYRNSSQVLVWMFLQRLFSGFMHDSCGCDVGSFRAWRGGWGTPRLIPVKLKVSWLSWKTGCPRSAALQAKTWPAWVRRWSWPPGCCMTTACSSGVRLWKLIPSQKTFRNKFIQKGIPSVPAATCAKSL